MTTNQTAQDSPPHQDAAEWVFPLEEIISKHRERITPKNEQFIPFMVEAWRAGDPVPRWTTIINQTDETISAREAGLKAVRIMASATDADYMVFIYDTHMTTLQNNPKTGQPWGPGEMQAMCDEEGFCETGLMRDNLVVTVVRRSDRKLYTRFLPYHFHKGEPILYDESTFTEWDDEADGTEAGNKMAGRIPAAMRAAVAQPTLNEMLLAEIGGGVGSPEFEKKFGVFDLDEARCHSLVAGAQALILLATLAGLPGMYVFLIPAFTEAEKEVMARFGTSLGDLLDSAEEEQTAADEPAGASGDAG